MANIYANLYDFLKENETVLAMSNKEITAYVFIDFCDLERFSEIVGPSVFDDGGVEAVIKDRYVVVTLNDIFEHYDSSILDYENCFDSTMIGAWRTELEEKYETNIYL